MEKNYDYTPREWIDNDILSQILGGDDMNGRCGCYGEEEKLVSRRSSERNGCGSNNRSRRNNRSAEHEGCGCGRDNDNRGGNRSAEHEGCGCGNNRSSWDDRYSIRRNSEHSEKSKGNCGYSESCSNDDSMYGFQIAMAYVPRQEWNEIYEAEDALGNGTLFSELNLPFGHYDCGNGCGCR